MIDLQPYKVYQIDISQAFKCQQNDADKLWKQ